MKKPGDSKRIFFNIPGEGILLLVILLISCQHFLDGAEIKKSIEDQIAYSNAPSFTITVDAPIGTGIVKTPSGGQTEKKLPTLLRSILKPEATMPLSDGRLWIPLRKRSLKTASI